MAEKKTWRWPFPVGLRAYLDEDRRCSYCGSEYLGKIPDKCGYCGSVILIPLEVLSEIISPPQATDQADNRPYEFEEE